MSSAPPLMLSTWSGLERKLNSFMTSSESSLFPAAAAAAATAWASFPAAFVFSSPLAPKPSSPSSSSSSSISV